MHVKRWHVRPPAPADYLKRLEPIHPLVAQILFNRGVVESERIEAMLKGTWIAPSPFNLGGVDEGVTLLRWALQAGKPVAVYGDYDADGVTATAVLVETLRALGGEVHPYIPSREREGYGLNAQAIRGLVEEGCRVLVTVDCGIRALDQVALAHSLGMQVVITDHHHVGSALPGADVVINPRLHSPSSRFSDLAGVGVAYRLAQGLIRVNHQVPLPSTQRQIAEGDLLDLVALGTIADMVSLLDDNHTLVAEGLARMRGARRPGLSALMQVARADPEEVSARTVGFTLAPRINAAGRLDQATVALDLLLAPDMSAALPLAETVDRLNATRRDQTLAVQDRARDAVLESGPLESLLFVASPDFQPGVVGLAAGRLQEEFYRPAVVVAVDGELCKGSARSIPEFHITQALDAVGEMLERHGGHAAAAGFTVRTSRLPELRRRLLALARQTIGDMVLTPSLDVDAEVDLASLSWDLFHRLDQLKPFGYGNPAPLLVSRNVSNLQARRVGRDGRHLKLVLRDSKGEIWDAIAFRQGERAEDLTSRVDLAYVLERNVWNGRVNLQLNVEDIHNIRHC
jgi:single-stranded-DNA-specific exonuclease